MQTLETLSEKHIPRIMSGIMTRDWQKAVGGLEALATEFHETNGLPVHPEALALRLNIGENVRFMISAALYAWEHMAADNEK